MAEKDLLPPKPRTNSLFANCERCRPSWMEHCCHGSGHDQVHYRANRGNLLFDDLAGIFRKTHGAVPALQQALAPLDDRIELAWVFGSLARGMEGEGSDIDLMVLGDVGFAELVRAVNPLQDSLRREINPVLYTPAEFRRRMESGDGFAREVLNTPQLFVKGSRDDIAELAGDQTASGIQR
ncbi:nucleotidyltransferase domain-containing protein [Luteimonas dalianensis]|uniref:nucleotidyltransferase domain-containing protein n=1 Tax=Luteimonas dalianensis TaxID=1148196 RepID=UPI003BF14286